MMEIEKYLENHSFIDLANEFAISTVYHPIEPLAICNYNQIDSPKTHPIVREARGIIINTETKRMQARAFSRFYNVGEVADEMPLFNWDKVKVTEKIDGSLVIFYHFDGKWCVNTRGSFANAPMFNSEWEANYHKLPITWTWHQGILSALGIRDLQELNGKLVSHLTYVGEFTSLWNKVVREYKTPGVYLLTTFYGEDEMGPLPTTYFLYPRIFDLKTLDDITTYINSHPEATFEGVVIQDDAFRRWKLKNLRYLALHRMKGEGQLYNPKNIVPYILTGEGDELLTYYPECTEFYRDLEAIINKWKTEMLELWEESKNIEIQKDFALKVKEHPLCSILFTARKTKEDPSVIFRTSVDLMIKRIKS